MITIDGSIGEGGGQMLRSSLALAMATGLAFRMINIRAKRDKPGLLRQHLTCIEAAQRISSARVNGAHVGSMSITFEPGPIVPGHYHFAIGTAGSTTLVLQAVLPALLIAPGESTISIEGGTHNSMAPPYEFFAHALGSALARAGADITSVLDRHGFHPAGGGRVIVHTAGHTRPHTPINISARGEQRSRRAISIVSSLPLNIAHRELGVLRTKLALRPGELSEVEADHPRSQGNALLLVAEYEHITEVFSQLGERNKSSEAVVAELVEDVANYERTGAPVGEHLADQLMVHLAVLAGGRFVTGPLSDHATTNLDILRAFGVTATAEPVAARPGHHVITIHPLAPSILPM